MGGFKAIKNMIINMTESIQIGLIENNLYINNKMIVTKPWGREIWLALNDKYCYKRIEINAGFKTSYQLHNFKLETNYIIKGEAEVWLENDSGVVEKFFMKEGDFFTVLPKRKHRVIAISDIVLQEVSTPEVDDVIRLNDEFNRSDGRVNEEHCKQVVCILAAGTGSRLEEISKVCHKSLLPFKNKAILSHILDKFDDTFDIVIAVGYLKDQIKEYVKMYHPNRSVKFIDVAPYQGVGSGPAYSIECCRAELQRPFYLCVCDFYTEDVLQNNVLSKDNWIGLSKVSTPELYSTVDLVDNRPVNLINKSKDGYQHAFTGIFYMFEYSLFWNQFDKYVDEKKELIDVFRDIKLFNFKVKQINWCDTGTLHLYKSFTHTYEGDKLYLHNIKNEFKYKKGPIFIKKIDTEGKINKLFMRSKYLDAYIPTLVDKGSYFFSYEFFEGKTLYEYNNKDVYLKFLNWYGDTFCKVAFTEDTVNELREFAYKFYKEKTLKRVELFRNVVNDSTLDLINNVNGVTVKPIHVYLDKVDWNILSNTVPTRLFHGDLQFDNIVYNGKEFKLIDWREEYGGNVEYGDLYYDLAKLYGGMELNYLKMKDMANYTCSVEKETVTLSQYTDVVLKSISNNEFKHMVESYGLDMIKVKMLTALIFLNMAPLHTNGFNVFLFFKAKLLFEEVFDSA